MLIIISLVLSNLLTLYGPTANAQVTITVPTAGTCFQHSGKISDGALATVYNLGSIQLNLIASEITPGRDAAPSGSTNASIAQATNNGSISNNGDVIGNIFTVVPPSGTNFVIVPGFQDNTTGRSNQLATSNVTISSAVSQDSTTGAESNLGISVGVVTNGTTAVGRAVVAIALDADANSTAAGQEIYPKSGTTRNPATITINGLGIVVPPSEEVTLSGTLQATFDPTPPTGIGMSGGNGNPTVESAIPGIFITTKICTITSPQGQLEAVLDKDDEASELYDKSGAETVNLLALGQIGTNTKVEVFDAQTSRSGSPGIPHVDTEPIIIRGKAGSGSSTRDQVFATGTLISDIDTQAETPSGSSLNLQTAFGNSQVAPITITFEDDNATTITTLQAIDIIISNSMAGATPSEIGFDTTQSLRNGFLGALRAALLDSSNSTTNSNFASGTTWGVASVRGDNLAIQESSLTSDNQKAVSTNPDKSGNNTEPNNNNFIDLRLECSSNTNPQAGWFAILNNSSFTFGTTPGTTQIIKQSNASNKSIVNNSFDFYNQTFTNISGIIPQVQFTASEGGANTGSNAILYASCSNNKLTLFPIQNGFDGTRDIIAITPKLQVANVSDTFPSDININALISGNNLTGTTTLNLAKLIGIPCARPDSSILSTQGVSVSEDGQLAINCSTSGTSKISLPNINMTSSTSSTQFNCGVSFSNGFNNIVSNACTNNSGSIAPAPTFFTGGTLAVATKPATENSPTVQGESRGILLIEAGNTSFSELLAQIGGGPEGTVFEISLPQECDIADDRDDNNTAASGATGGNNVTRVTATTTLGIEASFTGGTGEATLTNSNVLVPATKTSPALIRFRISQAPGVGIDANTQDALLVKFDSQDIFCPTTFKGDLKAKVIIKNRISNPSIISTIGNVILGNATEALNLSFLDDIATSQKGETSINTNIGPTPILVNGGATIFHTIKIAELDPRSIPIGGRVSARNVDPDNSNSSVIITRGQIWVIPSEKNAFDTAPQTSDISFSDSSLTTDGTPYIVKESLIDPNPPIGTLVIPVKKDTSDPSIVKTIITVKNLKLSPIANNSGGLIASLEFFLPDAGVIINTPGIASGNSASAPTLFTPYVQGSTKANTQLNSPSVQIGNSTIANQLLTSRLTTLGTPQINSFTKAITSLMNIATSKINLTLADISNSTDKLVIVNGPASSVDGGAEIVVSSGDSTPYDSVTVVSSQDGSFTAKLRGVCTNPDSITVNIFEQISGIKTVPITKTITCSIADPCPDVYNCAFNINIPPSIEEILDYITAQGGLAKIVAAGGKKLAVLIEAVKAALGLS